MTLYRLFRQTDVSGVSGTGLVAEVCVFSSGRVALSFLPGKAGITSLTQFDSLDDLLKIHGHDGATVLVPVSLEEYALNVLVPTERAA